MLPSFALEIAASSPNAVSSIGNGPPSARLPLAACLRMCSKRASCSCISFAKSVRDECDSRTERGERQSKYTYAYICMYVHMGVGGCVFTQKRKPQVFFLLFFSFLSHFFYPSLVPNVLPHSSSNPDPMCLRLPSSYSQLHRHVPVAPPPLVVLAPHPCAPFLGFCSSTRSSWR